jgi:C4-dicarboxylate-specific signal transduction histidine kinase
VEVSFGELTSGGHRVFTGFIRDISERKQAEEQLRASERTLQMTQAELARVSRLTTMGELAASIAHEVNQPLTAVINNASACLRLLANRNLESEVLRRALEGIIADGTRASAVLARIRAFIKKEPAEKALLDINEVIQEVLVLAGRELDENQVLLDSQLTTDLPLVLADRVQLQQVLLNLIMNSIEALTAVTSRPRLLQVQSRIDETGDILVSVCDSGTGFDLEVDRVFSPFVTTKEKGMGMGLSISRSLVEGHAGRLWASPNSPHGAVFSFTLPLSGSPS